MKCKVCGKRLGFRQVVLGFLLGDPTWHYCSDDCFVEMVAYAAVLGAIAEKYKEMIPKIETEMDNILGKIDERVRELAASENNSLSDKH